MRAPPPSLLCCTLLVGFLPLILADSFPTRDEPLPLSTLDDDSFPPDLFLTDLTEQALVENDSIDDINSDEVDDAFVEDEANEIPELQNEEEVEVTLSDEELERVKRSSDTDKNSQESSSARVRTGDTILNIRGAVRDAIGDAALAPGPLPSSRVDTFLIRPARPRTPRPALSAPPTTSQPAARGSERDVLVAPAAAVRVPCDLRNASDVRWYKDNELQPAALVSADGALWLARAGREHAGRWRCVGRGPSGRQPGALFTLTIYERAAGVWLAVDGRRLAADSWVPLRDAGALRVRCTADGGVPPPTLRWSISGGGDARVLSIQPTNYSIPGIAVSEASLIATRQLHGASLFCHAEQPAPSPAAPMPPGAAPMAPTAVTASYEAPHAKLDIHVTYEPSFVISRWPGFGVALWAGRGAALRCDVDSNPPARAWWLRDLANHSTVSEAGSEGAGGAEWEGGSGAAAVRWRALGLQHAGWYRCRATWLNKQYSSIGYYLNVAEAPEYLTEGGSSATPPAAAPAPPGPPLPAPHSRVDVPLGGSVQLNCPKGSVGCWWRRVVSQNASRWLPAGSARAHGALGIAGALYEEGGEYRCVGARSADVRALAELKRVTLAVTGSATARVVSTEAAAGGWRLECAACGRGVRALWLAPGADAPGAGGVQPATLTPDRGHCWRTVLTVNDAEERWCVAVNNQGGGVAVFPARRQAPPALRALHDAAAQLTPATLLLTTLVSLAAITR